MTSCMYREGCPDARGCEAAGFCLQLRSLQLSFARGRDDFHVLRILGNGQISAGKAAELLREIQAGGKPELPPFEAAPLESTEIVRVAFCANCRGQSD